MSNAYTKLSVVYDNLPAPAMTFAIQLNNALLDCNTESAAARVASPLVSEQASELERLAAEIFVEYDNYTNCDFDIDPANHRLFIAGEEACIEPTASVLQKTLEKFNIPTPLCLQWSCSTDQNIPNSNFGGIALVTRRKVHYLDLDAWYEQTCLALEASGEINRV